MREKVWLQRSGMTGDGASAMENIGQAPRSCEQLFELRGNSESELVRVHRSGWDEGMVSIQIGLWRNRGRTLKRWRAVIGPGRSVGGCRQGDACQRPFAAGKPFSINLRWRRSALQRGCRKWEKKEHWKKFMRKKIFRKHSPRWDEVEKNQKWQEGEK